MASSSESCFAGKVALITGAAQGIGEATAQLLAERGAKGLLLTDRNVERGEAVAASFGGIARFVAAELADPDSVAQLVPAAEQAFGHLDILCNIAATCERGNILNTDQALFDRILAVNVRAPFFLIQDAAKLMRMQGRGGAIVNVSSVNAHGGGAWLAAYSASKAALVTLSKNAATALAWDRIRVNCLLPAWVDTPAEHAVMTGFHKLEPNWLEKAEAEQPFGRLVKPLDVARAIAYLASSESGVLNGAVIDFDQTAVGPPPLSFPLEA
jgi:NAD(P)-dependent dehydrogenase (short-subunit alcohol dehydrogenase family)